MRGLSAVLTGAAMLLAAMPVAAQDVALVIANRFYDNTMDATQMRRIGALEAVLAERGFDVLAYRDLSAAAFDREAPDITRHLSDAGRVVVVLGGHAVETGRDAFLLTTDASRVDAFSAGRTGISIGAVLDLAAGARNAAVVAVADSSRTLPVGAGVQNGFTPGDVPSGVTVVAGPAAPLADFIEDELLRPGQTLARAAARAPAGVEVTGARPALALAPLSGADATLDEEAWRTAERAGTVAAYRAYLSRFPDGRYAGVARTRISRLAETPTQRSERIEADLNLTVAQRRDIQRDLRTLEHYQLGIDGIFGAGTRGAIRAWQRENGFPATGFVSANQIALLDRQAELREEELRAEREAREAEDRDYWAATGAAGDEAGLRAYLERYPDGLYSDVARAQLAEITREDERQRDARDRTAWARAESRNTIEAYRDYLERFPEGLYAETARARIADLGGDGAARRAEERLGLNQTARRLVELRLDILGLRPGRIDGNFDANTRAAIRRFQATRGLPVNGYLTEVTMMRLVAEVLIPG